MYGIYTSFPPSSTLSSEARFAAFRLSLPLTPLPSHPAFMCTHQATLIMRHKRTTHKQRK